MRILLVTLDSKFIHANLAVRYLKNFCSDLNVEIGIKEFTINQKQEYILGEILDSGAEMVCFSCYIWNIEYIKEIAYALKEAEPGIGILCGGPEVSYETGKFMEDEPYVDYVVFGEGEFTFREFLNVINMEKPELGAIKGLSYRNNGIVRVNEPRELVKDLDVIPYPYLEGENFDDKIIYYESSRGCPFCCSFCMSSIDKTMRNFSLERVKGDLKKLLNTRARQIKFVDRTFNADYRRSMEIMRFITENNVNNITVHFEITADIINDEFLDFLSAMPVNIFQFEIGVQSLNEDTIREINRHMRIEKLFYVVEKIKSFGNIHMHLDLIAGLPYEGYESFMESFNGIHNLYAEKIQLGFLKVLKGTKMNLDKEKHGIRYRKSSPYEVICTNYISMRELLKLKNIEELVDKYYNENYFEKSLKYIISSFYEKPFDFYEEFSIYWQKNGLYRMSHSRKKLYEFLYDFTAEKGFMSEELLGLLRYDYIYNNQHEELPKYLIKDSEEKYKPLKRILASDDNFRNDYFAGSKTEDRIINDFRIVEINKDITLFKYSDKDNIFDRCRTFRINNLAEEHRDE